MIVTRNADIAKLKALMDNILIDIHKSGPISACHLETLACIKKFYPDLFKDYEHQLMYLMGLFYKTTEPQSVLELSYKIHRDAIKQATSFDFTPVQASEFKEIKNNKIFSFSAPTSSGKSFLFRSLLSIVDNDVVIVLPSRALIAEYINTIRKIVPKNVLVLQFIEDVNRNKVNRRIYIVTPERADDVFPILGSLNIGLILFDEAQITEDAYRGMLFDALVRKCEFYIPNAKKVFAHPFVSNPEAQLTRNNLVDRTSYKVYNQNSVGKLYYTKRKKTFKLFSPFLDTDSIVVNDVILDCLNNNGSVLVYVSKNKLYSEEFMQDFKEYIDQCDEIKDAKALVIFERLKEYIGGSLHGDKHSLLLSLMKRGIVLHHGSMPLKMRWMIEEFVAGGFARICFATSTLIQGINMPFDVVWIDNFVFNGSEDKKRLDLKNLIGRAGRTTNNSNVFDYGYVVISESHKTTFCTRLINPSTLSEVSALAENIDDAPEDHKDIIEAIQNNTFNNDLKITESQKQRILASDVFNDVAYILEKLFNRGRLISADKYYEIPTGERDHIKECFRRIYVVHLRRQELTPAEKTVLSASIPMLLWRVQGKSFKEIVSLRQSYIQQKSKKAEINRRFKSGNITEEQKRIELEQLTLKRTPVAIALPNKNARNVALFPASPHSFKYDLLVYDTYDYIDKVINLSLTTPICAVLKLYYQATQDQLALDLSNFIQFGTTDITEIWLLKYGFSADDLEWLVPCVETIDEDQIIFKDIEHLSEDQKNLIERYL